jgi:stage II sporulation protein D
MRFLILIFAFLFSKNLAAHEVSAHEVSAQEIRVRLMAAQSSIQLKATGLQIFTDRHPCLNSKVRINSREAELIVSHRGQNWQILDLQNRQICELNVSSIQFRAMSLSLNHKKVSPHLILNGVKNDFEVVSPMDLEKYLIGVLSKEMPLSFPLEAFKAQAIASRSYAMKKILSSKNRSFDLESSIADQAYDFTAGTEKIRTAVEETRHLVLENEQNKLFPVYYHADCGGHTEEASEVWGNSEKMATVADEACPLESHSKWSFNISKFELSMRLRVVLQLAEAQIINIEEFESSSSGRKKSLKLILDDQSSRIISGQQLRNILGYDKLKSTMFAMNTQGSDIVFDGKGMGHGVGMCQWGARHLALGGESYQRILKHYYQGARIARLVTSHGPDRL